MNAFSFLSIGNRLSGPSSSIWKPKRTRGPTAFGSGFKTERVVWNLTPAWNSVTAEKLPTPAQAAVVTVQFRVRILSGDKLKGVDALPCDGMEERQSPRFRELVIQARHSLDGIRSLGGIGVQGAGIEVRTVGELVGIGVEKALDNGSSFRIGGPGRPLPLERNQDIPVDHAPDFLLGEGGEKIAQLADGSAQVEAVAVFVRRLDRPHLEEGAGVEDAAFVDFVELSVPARWRPVSSGIATSPRGAWPNSEA